MIDAWIQHPTPRWAADPMFDSLKRWLGVDEIPEIPLDATLAAMDAGGVDVALLTAWHGPSGALISNDEVAGWVREAPERLVGVASVDLKRPMEAVRELRRCVEVLGFRALRVLPWWWELPPDDRRYYPLYAACVDLGIPFCLQVGHTGPLYPSEYGRPIPHLDRVALEFPELVLVGGHIGYPWTEEMIALATKYPNVYIDTSAYKPSRYPEALVAYLRRHGREKVLFGTNYPMVFPRQCRDGLEALGLSAATLRAFTHDNAARVFGLADQARGT